MHELTLTCVFVCFASLPQGEGYEVGKNKRKSWHVKHNKPFAVRLNSMSLAY